MTTTKTKIYYPNTVEQTTGGKYATWIDKNVIKDTLNGYSQTHGIKSKKSSPNRPSTLTCKDFRCDVPVGANITKIVVELKHSKVIYNGKYINIPAPTVELLYDGKVLSSKASNSTIEHTYKYSKKATAPTSTATVRTVSYTGNTSLKVADTKSSGAVAAITNKGITPLKQTMKTYKLKYQLPQRDKVNSNKLAVRINYPANTNTNAGYLRLWWVRLKVTYTPSSYNLSMAKVSGGYNDEEYELKVNINRTSKTNYIPSVVIDVPIGFSYIGTDGTADYVTKIDNRTLKWTPSLLSGLVTCSDSVILRFTVNVTTTDESYTGVFNCTESLNNVSASHTATILDKPDDVGNDDDPDSSNGVNDDDLQPETHTIVHAVLGENIQLNLKFTPEEYESIPRIHAHAMSKELYLDSYSNPDFEGDMTLLGTFTINCDAEFELVDGYYQCKSTFYSNTLVEKTLVFRDYNGAVFRSIDVAFRPANLSKPCIALLTLSEEEKNRLGDGYAYMAQLYMKETTSDNYVRDWGKNFRIGIFNNPIESNQNIISMFNEEFNEKEAIVIDSTDYDVLTIDEIFENAKYWSDPISSVNEYNELTLDFRYDEDYPLYIMICGDYEEASTPATINFTEPCIIELDSYNGREENGLYPTPIRNLISPNGEASEVEIPNYEMTSPMVFYDFPIEEEITINEDTAIRGVELSGNIESSDELVLYAKLKSPRGMGQRSIIINDSNNADDGDYDFTVGGIGDLWNFNASEFEDVETWGIEVNASNILIDDIANLNFGTIQVTFYLETINTQNINIFVNEENLAFYNAFILDVDIPPGLETDVDFLSIDGTDTNYVHRQNIREKEIEIEFEIGEGCDLETSTKSLRQITKLLQNEKDRYNRPIPKRITFSHMSDVYFEYILKDSPDVSIDINNYVVKAKLLIPSGTAYKVDSTVTNVHGYVQGLAAVSPVITFKPTEDTIEIRETISNQKFNMGYSGDWLENIVEIDCENRIVWLKNNEDDADPINISQCVDINTDWFKLHGEYHFESTNCYVRTVDYTERW